MATTSSFEADAAATALICNRLQPDWLIVDHYGLDWKWHMHLRSHTGQIMVIDDLANRVHECDLLLDQTLGRLEIDYQALVSNHCSILTGTHYALLRPEFAEARERSLAWRASRTQIKHILISMGGFDPENVTGSVLSVISKMDLPFDIRFTVVMTSGAPHLAAVQKQAADIHKAPVDVRINVSDMAKLLSKTDLVIGAAGSSAWERCCLGVPAIILVLSENQRANACVLANESAAIKTNDISKLPILLEELSYANHRVNLISEKAKNLCDGGGTKRAINALEAQSLVYREATLDDCWNVLEWRNYRVPIEYYRSNKVISYEEHFRWFKVSLDNPSRSFWFWQCQGIDTGYVRIDFPAETRRVCSVSIVIAPTRRGMGWGERCLRMTTWRLSLMGCRCINAEVHKENVASQKLFSRCGFAEISENESFTLFSYKIGD